MKRQTAAKCDLCPETAHENYNKMPLCPKCTEKVKQYRQKRSKEGG